MFLFVMYGLPSFKALLAYSRSKVLGKFDSVTVKLRTIGGDSAGSGIVMSSRSRPATELEMSAQARGKRESSSVVVQKRTSGGGGAERHSRLSQEDELPVLVNPLYTHPRLRVS